MKYVLEGVAYDTLEAARGVAKTMTRAVKIEWGDSTYGAVPEYEWHNTAEYVEPEPVDRSERLLRRFEPAEGTQLPQSEE